MWTTRHGKLIPPQATLVQVDDDPAAIGMHRPVHLGVPGDVAETARAVADALGGSPGATGYRSPEVRARIAGQGRWRDVAYSDESDGERIDPRTLSIALDDLLPAERTRRASALRRRSSRSGSAWPRRSGPRSPGRTGWR
jgi:thiamine pyrophosphate-dependent acetolactate synthase large subunit-like protein